MDLTRVGSRESLKPRNAPYFHRLEEGRFIGFRPSAIGGAGVWCARTYDPKTGQRHRTLGEFANLPPSDRYAAAKREAEAWFQHLELGGPTDMITVADACRRYGRTRPDAEARFRRLVYDDPLGAVELAKLRREHVDDWTERLKARPALVTRNKKGRTEHRPRSLASVNRDMVPLRAALNIAKDLEAVASDRAWSVALRPIENTGKRRNIYLDRDQRRRLLDALADDIRPFVRGLCFLPLRPGALAGLLAGDFDPRRRELVIGKDKTGERRILLPESTAALLKEQARRKLPAAPLFTRADGSAWNKDSWKGPIKDAVHAAGLPPATSAYTLRHSSITDLVTAGLDLLTVAKLAGTSVAMIEKHYGHLQRAGAAEALAGLLL